MGEYVVGFGFDFGFGVTSGETCAVGVEEVLDGDEDGVAGGFFFAPLWDAQFFGFEGGEQFDGDGFDAFDLGGSQVGFVEQVEDGEGFFVQAFAGGAGFLFVHALGVLQ